MPEHHPPEDWLDELAGAFPVLADQVFREGTSPSFIRSVWIPDLQRSGWLKREAAISAAYFQAEAQGLDSLAATETIRVPKVLAVGVSHPWILLEDVSEDPPPGSCWEAESSRSLHGYGGLGRGLARLHQCAQGESYGWDRDNWIGRSVQINTRHSHWAAFFLENRLLSMIERTRLNRTRALPETLVRGIPRFLEAADRLLRDVPSTERASLVHGDLWAGNVVLAPSGCPALIDPAVYCGHREVDLAMITLFSTPSADFWAGYDEVFPRADGWKERVALYNSYHAWNHLHLFGDSYLGMVQNHMDCVLRSGG